MHLVNTELGLLASAARTPLNDRKFRDHNVSAASLKATETWQAIAEGRRHEINDAIPQEYKLPQYMLGGKSFMKLPQSCGLLSDRELDITNSTATELLPLIHGGFYSSVEVTTAFCKRAAIAHQTTNCLAWVMFDQALAEAASLDGYLRKNKKVKGPLHGLPISVKEHIYLAGTPSTSGLVAWADDIATKDALIIETLRDSGAVFHVKTTNPQTLMALETTSNLYGTTLNPYNSSLTPGGSSGGEAALIAMRGSLLGIGTDIGGSIRAPSGFTGIYGLKPSVGRLPHGGLSGLHGGMESIVGCVGPMATCTSDLRLFCKIVLQTKPWFREPSLFPMPWRDQNVTHVITAGASDSLHSVPAFQEDTQPRRKLRIGYMLHDGIVHPHPPITRALTQLMQRLCRSGHTLIPFSPSLHPALISCISKLYFQDAATEYNDTMTNSTPPEPTIPILTHLLAHARTPKQPLSLRETWSLHQTRTRLQEQYTQSWNEARLDTLICPVHPSVAPAHGEATYWGYTSFLNILDLSSAVIPLGKVEKQDTWENWPKEGELEGDEFGDGVRYDGYYGVREEGSGKYEGAPVAVQIVGRRLGEEDLLDFVDEIATCWLGE